jgi:uncharacterized protein (TIGR02145 family)
MNRNSFTISAIISLLVLAILQTGCKKDESPEKVPVIATHEITDIKIKTAVSGGTITSDMGAEIIFRGICWNTNPNPTIADNKTTEGSGAGNFKSPIEGLAANTTYYVRAYATNINGTGYGSTMSFTTLASHFTDNRDGNVYELVPIGNQIWMAENLRYLPALAGPNFVSNTAPYYYVYGYNGTNLNAARATANYSTYGVLYNWSASINACPAGWHLPNDAEWKELTDYLGGVGVAGGKLKATGTMHWNSPNTGATNESGFSALPGGGKMVSAFHHAGRRGYWWSATEVGYPFISLHIIYNELNLITNEGIWREYGYSVRCIKD